MHPFLQGLRPTLHIAHRGGSLLGPENTLWAFRRAVEEFHTDMLELDVHLTKDGEVVVSHDGTLERCTDGRGAIGDLTLAQVQAVDAGYHFSPDGQTFPLRGQGVRIPTLREVLRAFPSLRLNIELKDAPVGGEDVFARLLRAEKAVDRVCVGSESDALADRLHDELPEALHFYPRNALMQFVLSLKAGNAPVDDPRFTVLDMPLSFQGYRLVDAPLLDAVHRLGKWLNVWTVDDPDDMRRCILEGVGGVMTDRPDLLRDALDRFGRPAR